MKSNEPKHIDFVVIGAQKAGTTWLYDRLNEHSEFSLPPKKELHYFDRSKKYLSPSFLADQSMVKKMLNQGWWRHFRRDMNASQGDPELRNWYSKFYLKGPSDDWYLALFKDLKGFTGDITPSYSILDEGDVQHMSQIVGGAKIIFMLRNPIHRAWSHYRYNELSKQNSSEKIDLDHAKQFFGSQRQKDRSDYLRTIERYQKHFSAGQIMLGFYDAIEEQPVSLLKQIVAFIGADADRVSTDCNVELKSNVSKTISMPEDVAGILHEMYDDSILKLADHCGSFANLWAGKDELDTTSLKPTIII